MDYNLDDWKVILATCVLIACMLWDISVGYAKIFWWLPNNLLVLSALTIQILGFIDTQKVNIFGPFDEEGFDVLVVNQLEMDAAKLTMCVFIGCVLPGMAMAGIEGRWNYVYALTVSLSISIATEFYVLQNVGKSRVQNEAGPWFVSSGVLLSVGAVLLILLLAVAILCGKFIRSFAACRNSVRFSKEYEENPEDKWERFASEVKKSWIAARSWKTYYLICNSAFSPGATVIVTICVAAMIAKVACRSSLFHHSNGGDNLKFYLQCVFVSVGWFLMICRCINAALYCPHSLVNGVIPGLDDIFKLPIVILVNQKCPRLAYFILNLDFHKSRNILISAACLVPLFPLVVLILAIYLVMIFCRICCSFSALLVHIMLWLWHLLKPQKEIKIPKCVLDQFDSGTVAKPSTNSEKVAKPSKIPKTVAKPSEIPKTVAKPSKIPKKVAECFWKTNKKSFERIEGKLDGGIKTLHSVISKYKVPDQYQRLRSKGKWVKTVSSICKDIADLPIVVDMKDALALYRETQNVLNFVDWPENIVVDPFNIFVALNFNALEDSINWEGAMRKLEEKMAQQSDTSAVVEKVREFAEMFESPEDNSLLARLREYNSGDDLDELLSTLVSQIIVSHLLEAPDLILKYTRHWAQTFDEKKIEEAIELAGKVRRLLQPVDDDRNIIRSFPPYKSDNLPVAP